MKKCYEIGQRPTLSTTSRAMPYKHQHHDAQERENLSTFFILSSSTRRLLTFTTLWRKRGKKQQKQKQQSPLLVATHYNPIY